MSTNSMNGALSGVPNSTLIRESGTCKPIGEVYKAADGWKSWAGYEIPAEFRGTWDLKTEAVFAINEANRLYKGELSGFGTASI
jgi:hypothetical protein